MRTPDGRLAILDFGLMTQIDSNIKYGMIEAISHLIHRDYEAIVEDFVTLDFIPKGIEPSITSPLYMANALVMLLTQPIKSYIADRESIDSASMNRYWRGHGWRIQVLIA